MWDQPVPKRYYRVPRLKLIEKKNYEGFIAPYLIKYDSEIKENKND